MNRRLQANHSFYKFLCVLTLIVGVIYLIYPIKSYIIDNVSVTLLPIKIMFIDQSTKSGLLLTNFILTIIGAWGICTVAYVALSFDITIMNIAPRVDLVEIDFKDLDDFWSHTATSTVAHRHMVLRNICQKYVDLREYF